MRGRQKEKSKPPFGGAVGKYLHGPVPDMTSEGDQRTARWLLAVVTFLIVYGSLYPFRFAGTDTEGVLDLLGRLPWARSTRSDIAANVLLYLPFGACLGWMLTARLGGMLAAVVTTAVGVLLSTLIEVGQIFETRRVASLGDIVYNGLGSLAGAALAIVLQSARRGIRRHAFSRLLAQPIAASLLLLWVGYRLAPFAPTLNPAEWRAALAALVAGPWLAPFDTLRYFIPWLVVGQALRTLLSDRALLPALAATMLVVLVGLVLVVGRSPVAVEAAAMALALALSWPLSQLAPGRSAAMLAWLLAVMIAVDGLTPFDFRMDPGGFGLVPFQDALIRYRAANLPEMFHKCFLYGGLVWLLVRAGLRAAAATFLAGGLVFGIELLQAWLPEKPADITDPLIVIAAGGLIAMFDGARPAVRGGPGFQASRRA